VPVRADARESAGEGIPGVAGPYRHVRAHTERARDRIGLDQYDQSGRLRTVTLAWRGLTCAAAPGHLDRRPDRRLAAGPHPAVTSGWLLHPKDRYGPMVGSERSSRGPCEVDRYDEKRIDRQRISTQHNAYGRGRRPPGRPSSSLAPRSAASCMCSPPMTRPTPCASSVCPLWSRSAPGWRLLGPSAPAWGSGGYTPGHPAALLAVEEARARSVKVPVTGAGSLFCVGAVIGPDRRLPCRARTPSPGRLTSAMQSRTAECDQPPGTERTAG
jgi:hypothetical protein